jgi:hypothetical protein
MPAERNAFMPSRSSVGLTTSSAVIVLPRFFFGRLISDPYPDVSMNSPHPIRSMQRLMAWLEM